MNGRAARAGQPGSPGQSGRAAPAGAAPVSAGGGPLPARPLESLGVFIALGSNLGDRAGLLRAALDALAETAGVQVLACSRFHETAPVGGPAGQPPYLNAVAELATTLPPLALLRRMQEVEQRFGRTRTLRHGPRLLDLDLLLYHDQRIETEDLTLPHPRMWERAFVLAPLAEICPAAALVQFRTVLADRVSGS